MRPCGLSKSARIRLGGVDFVPDLSGALYAPEFRTLLIADLHLEKGSSLARRGVHLPPYDTRHSLLQLEKAIDEAKPERLIFLGDTFHDGKAHERLSRDDAALIQRMASRLQIIWITGNHDPKPAAGVPGLTAQEVALGPIALRHEPRILGEGELEIAGHLHPAATVVHRGQRIRCKCFIGDERRLVMPAFGSYTGALSISAEPFGQLFAPDAYHVWMLSGRSVHRFPAKRVR
jgi:hypothetical protein